MEAKHKKKFEQIYKDNVQSLYRYAVFMLSDKEKAEDVTSETFRKMVEKMAVDEVKNPKAWLFTVMRNTIFNEYKKGAKLAVPGEGVMDEIEDSEADFTEIIMKEEMLGKIKDEVAKLGDADREVIALKIWEGYKFEQIAEIVGEKESTVKLRYYRALEKMKHSLSPHIQEFQPKVSYMAAAPLFIQGFGALAAAPEFVLSASAIKAIAAGVGGILSGAALNTAKAGFLHTVAGKIAAIFTTTFLVATSASTIYFVGSGTTPGELLTGGNIPGKPPVLVLDEKYACGDPVIIDEEKGFYICETDSYSSESLPNYEKCVQDMEGSPDADDGFNIYGQLVGKKFNVYAGSADKTVEVNTVDISEDCEITTFQVQGLDEVTDFNAEYLKEVIAQKRLIVLEQFKLKFDREEANFIGLIYDFETNKTTEINIRASSVVIYSDEHYVVIEHSSLDGDLLSVYSLDSSELLIEATPIPLDHEKGESMEGMVEVISTTQEYVEVNYTVSYMNDGSDDPVREERKLKIYMPDSSEAEDVTYTNENYPELEITYPKDWVQKEETFLQDADFPARTRVVLSKEGHELSFSMEPSTGFGWGTGCYTFAEIDYKAIGSEWFRITNEDSSFTYTLGLNDRKHNFEEMKGIFEARSDLEKTIEDYEACGIAGPHESAMATNTNFDDPTDTTNAKLHAIFDIELKILGEKDDAVLKEADEIVKGMGY